MNATIGLQRVSLGHSTHDRVKQVKCDSLGSMVGKAVGIVEGLLVGRVLGIVDGATVGLTSHRETLASQQAVEDRGSDWSASLEPCHGSWHDLHEAGVPGGGYGGPGCRRRGRCLPAASDVMDNETGK